MTEEQLISLVKNGLLVQQVWRLQIWRWAQQEWPANRRAHRCMSEQTCGVCTSTETGNSNTGNKCQERTFSLMAVGIKNATLEDSLAGFFFTKINIVLLYNPVTMFLTVYKN